MRAALAAAVAERARATREAERLEGRAALEGAVPEVRAAAAAQHHLAEEAARAITRLRAELRGIEGEVATLEARADGAGGPTATP